MSEPDRRALVPADFEVPTPPEHSDFRFEPLGAEHNERDFAAWMGSIEHIKATPGFVGRDWPVEMALDDNLGDLVRHAEDFAARTGFTYSILAGDDVIGCLYIYPSRGDDYDADVRSWVTAERAELDAVLWRVTSDWLARDWPFTNPEYAART